MDVTLSSLLRMSGGPPFPAHCQSAAARRHKGQDDGGSRSHWLPLKIGLRGLYATDSVEAVPKYARCTGERDTSNVYKTSLLRRVLRWVVFESRRGPERRRGSEVRLWLRIHVCSWSGVCDVGVDPSHDHRSATGGGANNAANRGQNGQLGQGGCPLVETSIYICKRQWCCQWPKVMSTGAFWCVFVLVIPSMQEILVSGLVWAIFNDIILN